jgi:hypothetical protein
MAYKQKNNPFKKNSPNKFIGGLVGKAMGGIGNLLGGKKIFGGNRRGGGFNTSALLGGIGQVFGGGNNSGSGNVDATQTALNTQQNVPLTKKKSKYKKK